MSVWQRRIVMLDSGHGRGDSRRVELAGRAIALLGLLVILLLTTLPTAEPVSRPLWCIHCLRWGTTTGADMLLNVALYIPLGFGLRLAGWRRRTGMVAVLALTLTIETLQGGVIPGRFASLLDVGTNVLGGALGMAVGGDWRHWFLPSPRESELLARSAAGVWLVLIALTAWAMHPSLPLEGFRILWRSGQPPGDGVPGRVLGAWIDGIPAPPAPLIDVTTADLLRPESRLRAQLVAGDRVHDNGPALSVVAPGGRAVLLFGQDERDVVLRLRTHSADLHLLTPTLRVQGAVSRAPTARRVASPGDTVTVEATIRPYALSLLVSGPEGHTADELILGPGAAWRALLSDAGTLARYARWVSALWLAVTLLPLGYWTARSSRWHADPGLGRIGRMALLAGTILVGLAVVAPLLGMPRAHWSEWGGALAGAGGGWAAGRLTRHRLRKRVAPEADGARVVCISGS